MPKYEKQYDVRTHLFRDEVDGFHISNGAIVLNRPIEFRSETGDIELVLRDVAFAVNEDDLGIRRLSFSGSADKRFNDPGRVMCGLHMSQSREMIPFLDAGHHTLIDVESGPFADDDKIMKLIGNPAKYAQRVFLNARMNR
ncbi:hypothetical protein [Rhizobium sp. FKY42]|uniref:hypothetical protein n=1 Tax=Rhizobium sp. FKY42 TaxID=2562310 RepID=UPI0010BF7376|nr:hypothetical protein [Rhizobium sp. FKY42]